MNRALVFAIALVGCNQYPDQGAQLAYPVQNTQYDFGQDPIEANTTSELHAIAQKGPMLLGSTVRIIELDGYQQSTGHVIETTVQGGLGIIKTEVDFHGDALIEVSGAWIDEITGNQAETITLRRVVTLPVEDEIAITAFTELATPIALNLMAAGSDATPANLGAEDLVHAALALSPEWFDPSLHLGTLAIRDNDVSSAYAFYASAALVASSDPDQPLDEWLSLLAEDMADDGDLIDAHRQLVHHAAGNLNIADLSQGAAAWFDQLGIDGEAPDLRNIVDLDGDGLSDAIDDDQDGDGYMGPAYGGDDCDDRDALTFPYQ
jgi:hypothetical protein